ICLTRKRNVIQIVGVPTTPKPLYDLCLVVCFDTTSVVHFPSMQNTLANHWHPSGVVNGAPWTFINHLLVFHLLQANEDPMLVPTLGNVFGLFEECDAKQVSGGYLSYLHMEVIEFDMGWDMSLRAVGRRVTIVDSVWLQKENVGGLVGGVSPDRATSGCLWTSPFKKTMSPINPVLGFNLEGVASGENGALWVLWPPRVKSVDNHKNSMLEYPWVGESMDDAKNSAYAETMWKFKKVLEKINCNSRGSMALRICDFGLRLGAFYDLWKKCGVLGDERRMEEFSSVLSDCHLEDLGYEGLWFTWERGGRGRRMQSLRDWIMDLDMVDRDKENLMDFMSARLEMNLEIDKRRRVNQVTCLIKNDLSLVHDGKGLFDVANAHFTQLFTFQGQGDSRHILEGVMALTKASDSDGLPTLFYQKFWHIVERDIGAYCLEILNDVISTNINKTHIVLILEVANPTRMQQFHPISFCSVLYKIVLKVVVHRF
ncbi:hypothetical protein Goarm_009989, partial [Gossypium armourianum]|nr:hypothetical protein [Gossypium armourianum]